jgi:glucose-1-phosphate cytidylyltransferase
VKTFLLAGGLGTRLGDEADLAPKPMVEIGGRPILSHIMSLYARHGFTDFVVALGYKANVVKDYFRNHRTRESDLTIDIHAGTVVAHDPPATSWTVHLVETGLATQTGGRVRRLAPWLGGDRTFLLTYGDGLSDVDLGALVAFHRRHGKLATLTAVHPPVRCAGLRIDGDEVVGLAATPRAEDGWINGGFFVLEREVLDLIPGDDTVWERGPLEALAARGELMAFRHPGFWEPMDTPRDRKTLEALWRSGAAPWTAPAGPR